MRILSYSIEIDEVEFKGNYTPINKYCGVYPSEAFKTPQELAQSILDVLNEEFGTEMTVVSAMKIKETYIGGEFLEVDTASSGYDLETAIKISEARQERIAKNKKELGF